MQHSRKLTARENGFCGGRALITIVCSTMLLTSSYAAPETATSDSFSVGVFGHRAYPILDHLRDQGMQATYLNWGQASDTNLLGQFNVLVLATMPAINEKAPRNSHMHMRPDYAATVFARFREFVESGGGLLIYSGSDENLMSLGSINTFLAPWGAQLLDEQVIDNAHHYKQRTGIQWEYGYTDNIADHPITEGVKTIFYPLRAIYQQANNPLSYDTNWTVLVRGAPEAASFPVKAEQHFRRPETDTPGTYPTAPPLAGTRQVGKGRVVVFGWSSIHTFFNLNHYMCDNVYFTTGGNGIPSDGLRLLEQALTFLADPSRGSYPVYTNQPLRQKPTGPASVIWKDQKIGAYGQDWRWYKGVIGARTALTGGSGSVKEYAEAARAATLDFVGFMEDFAKLTPETWKAFCDECATLSGPDLLLLPGQTYQRGRARDRYFKISDSPWPPSDMLTSDGNAVLNYLYEHFHAGRNTLGPYDIRNEPSPHWLSRAYNSFAVTTTKAGQTDVDLEPFLYVTQNGDKPRPVAVDLVDSPAELTAAAGRFLNYRMARSQEELRRALKNPDAHGHYAMVSDGPIITNWQAAKNHARSYGRYAPGAERFMLRLQAESDQPLKEALIYNGTRLCRRFALQGTSCDLTINFLHDRQYTLVAVVTDRAGRMAVRSQIQAQDLFNMRGICGDRQNSINSSYDVDASGFEVTFGSAFLQPKFNAYGVGGCQNPQTTSAVPYYWDGSPGAYPKNDFYGRLVAEKDYEDSKKTDKGRWVGITRMELPIASRDVICQAVGIEYCSDDWPTHYHSFWPVKPMDLFTSYTRFFEFKKTPDQAAAMLVEGAFTMLRDGKHEPGEYYWREFSHEFYAFSGYPQRNADCIWALVDPESGLFLSGTTPANANGLRTIQTISPGGYIAFGRPNDMTALFPLDEPVDCFIELREGWLRAHVGYRRQNTTFKKGETSPYRFVVFNGRIGGPADLREVQSFRTAYGLHGGAPAYTITPRCGEVLSTRYVLELKAVDGGFGGTVSKAPLPTRLPVRVRGVNPNWTCGLVDRVKKTWFPIGTINDRPEFHADNQLPPEPMACATLDLSSERDVWMGNVVVCDQPDLTLTLLPDGEGHFVIEAHNPGETELTARVRSVPEFNLVPDLIVGVVTVPAGQSILVGQPAS